MKDFFLPFLRKGTAITFAVLMAFPSGSFAQDAYGDPPYAVEDFSTMQEAGRAVFGRVFGWRDQGGEIYYYEIDATQHNPKSAASRSAVIPGWGQAFNGQKTKGLVFCITTLTALTGSLLLYKKSLDSYSDYESQGLVNGSAYDDYSRQRTQSLVLASVGIGLWIYGIFDAHKNAYNPLWTKAPTFEVSLLPHGAKVSLGTRF